MQPVIKWTGSKRKQADEIISYMPKNINTYYEPFLGSGAVLMKLLETIETTNNINIKHFVCSDINKDLIDLFNIIKHNPNKLIKIYTEHYNNISSISLEADRNKYYINVRNKYNELDKDDELKPYLFYWILRTCFNGLIRYNKEGKFNTAYHPTRLGIKPEKLSSIIYNCNRLLNKYNVEFINKDYKDVLSNTNEDDFIYMDPPYFNSGGMYFFEGFNQNEFFEFLSKLNCKYAFSYDGKSGKENLTVKDIPENIYTEHKYVNSGYSSFKKMVSGNDAYLKDSLYIKN